MNAVKKFFVLLFLTPLFSVAQAQTVQVDLSQWLFGAKFGFNFNSVDSTDAFENTWEGDESFSFGLKSIYSFTENHALNTDLLYDRRVMKTKSATDSIESKYKYITLAPMYQYKLTDFPLLFLAGVNLSFNVDSDAEVATAGTVVNTEITNEKSVVFGLLAGLGYQHTFANGWAIQPEATYNFALSDTNDLGTGFKIHTIQLALSLLY